MVARKKVFDGYPFNIVLRTFLCIIIVDEPFVNFTEKRFFLIRRKKK